MKDNEILKYVDHTMLAAASAWHEIKNLCNEAIKFNMASVCVPPAYIKRIRDSFGKELNICTVIGFPLGYDTAETKVFSLKKALADGGNEFDMVINLGDVKNGDYDKITDEISVMKQSAGEKILKVIIETCYLTDSEKIEMCRCVTQGKADYIKTSTGFGTSGADIKDIALFKKYMGENVKIKAAGGIRSREDMIAFLESGCSRLGTSSALKILSNMENDGY